VGFQSSKEYRSLPGLGRVIVDRWTYIDFARRTWIPVSSLAADLSPIGISRHSQGKLNFPKPFFSSPNSRTEHRLNVKSRSDLGDG